MEEGPNASLYRLDPDLSVTGSIRGIIVSNGPCWSPDDRTLLLHRYLVRRDLGLRLRHRHRQHRQQARFAKMDTARRRLRRRHGRRRGRRLERLVYVGKLIRYAPDGPVDRVIDMPVKKVTSVNFGGPNLDILYVTSMAKPPLPRFPDDPQPRGALFAIHGLGVRGVPEARFAG